MVEREGFELMANKCVSFSSQKNCANKFALFFCSKIIPESSEPIARVNMSMRCVPLLTLDLVSA